MPARPGDCLRRRPPRRFRGASASSRSTPSTAARSGSAASDSAEVGVANDLGGMYVSSDGGVTWRRDPVISAKNYWCHAIVFHPTEKGTVYAAFTAQGARSGIYKSADGGVTWTQLTRGLPTPERFGRTSLAISRSNPSVLYAFASDEAGAVADLRSWV